MPFLFFSESYAFNSKWDAPSRAIGVDLLQTSVREGWTSTRTINAFKDAGISYRRTDMLADISRANATEWSRTEDAYERADMWFNSLEKYRELYGKTDRATAIKFMQDWKDESWDTLEDIEAAQVLEGLDYVPGS